MLPFLGPLLRIADNFSHWKHVTVRNSIQVSEFLLCDLVGGRASDDQKGQIKFTARPLSLPKPERNCLYDPFRFHVRAHR